MLFLRFPLTRSIRFTRFLHRLSTKKVKQIYWLNFSRVFRGPNTPGSLFCRAYTTPRSWGELPFTPRRRTPSLSDNQVSNNLRDITKARQPPPIDRDLKGEEGDQWVPILPLSVFCWNTSDLSGGRRMVHSLKIILDGSTKNRRKKIQTKQHARDHFRKDTM